MTEKPQDDQYPDEIAERRARAAIQRSFQMPYKPQREMVGKASRAAQRKRVPSKTTKKAK